MRLAVWIPSTLLLAACALPRQSATPGPAPTGGRAASAPQRPRSAPDSLPADRSGADQEGTVHLAGRAAPSVVSSVPPRTAERGRDSAAAADVARRASELFGEETAVGSAAAEDEPHWDMDVRSYETQERVAHYVELFTGKARENVVARLERGTRYESMIRARLRAGGLPEDLYYLAFVESGFDPHAYSRAAAVGMWQFMSSTARGMGLRVDSWVDERRDPVRSTSAAVRFIRGLRDQFGSLYLAAAAYNGGPGRVARGLALYAEEVDSARGEDAFFVLAGKDYLRNETREYVPQIIATALIAKDPLRYGLVLRALPALAYDSVRVEGGTPLSAAARASETSVKILQELNPHLLRGMTPPHESYTLRVPVGSGAGFATALATLPAAERIATRSVTTRRGETVERLAAAGGVPASLLRAFNPRLEYSRKGRLVAGQRVVLPTHAVVVGALEVPDPRLERSAARGDRRRLHTVREGETVSGIARRYATTTEHLMRLNRLRRALIFPGQTLVLAAPRAASAKASPRIRAGRPRASTNRTSRHTRGVRQHPAPTASLGSTRSR